MRLSLAVLWLFTGVSITGPKPWWWWLLRLRNPVPPHVPPDIPEEEFPSFPHRLLLRIIGAVGGVIGGWIFTVVFGPYPTPWIIAGPQPDPWMLVVAAATTVGAFIGASLLTDLYGLVRSSRKVPRV